MFPRPTTNEETKQIFSDVCTSEGPKTTHAAKPVARTEMPPYERRTAVSVMRKQHLCTMGLQCSFKKSTRGVSGPHEGNTDLSIYP